MRYAPEPDVPYVVVTGSDGSFVWTRYVDYWAQVDGPSWAWNVLVHAAAERKWTIALPGNMIELEILPRFRVEQGNASYANTHTWEVWDRAEGRNCRVAQFGYNHPRPQQAAEAECRVLNEDYEAAEL